MTQYEKILAMMISGREDQWWHAEDLMSCGDIFVGYKAQARISELAIDYPELIERKPSIKGNKQHMYRFRFDNTLKGLQSLPIDLQKFCRAELSNAGRHWQTMSDRVDFEERNGVRTAVIREVVLTV